jgi:hypothetical protein
VACAWGAIINEPIASAAATVAIFIRI